MREFAVRIEQPCAAKMKIVNYMEMTITAKSWLDAQVLVLRTQEQDERQPEWDDFDVEEIIESSPEASVEVLCPGQDDDEVNRLLDGRIALDDVKEQLSPENYEWVKKETVRRPAPKERIRVRHASDPDRAEWFYGGWEKTKEWLREAKAADSRIDFSRLVVFGVFGENWYLYQVDADLEILASKLSTQEECKAAEQSLIDQGFCLNSPMQILKEDIHKLERYTSSSADKFPFKEKPTYHEQLKSLLKPICEALTALGVCEVVAQFSGSGDEGEFYEIEYLPASETRVVPKDLADALYDWLCYALPGGWEINEGSSGTVKVDVQATIAHVDIDLNVMETENEEYDI